MVMLSAFHVRSIALALVTAIVVLTVMTTLHVVSHPSICEAGDPCHCHETKEQCLCALGSKLGDECLQTECNWHEGTILHHGGQCDTCDGLGHCHGCFTEDECNKANEGQIEHLCAWNSNDNVCEDLCSSNACSQCMAQDTCEERGLCAWASDSCVPKCGRHICGGCMDQHSCESSDCAWDGAQSVCEPTCHTTAGTESTVAGTIEARGLGCWTWSDSHTSR